MPTTAIPPDADAAADAGADRSRPSLTDRLAGAGGLVFVALLLVQNVVRASGPSLSAAPASVTSYFADHRLAALLPLSLFPLGMVAILSFTAGIRARAIDGDGRWWADLGGLAVITLAGLFSIVNLTEIVIAAHPSDGGASPQVVRALWTLHAAAFGLDLAAIAIALVGLSHAARRAGLIPRWLALLALPGAGCLFLASTQTVPIADGAPWIYVGFVGFAVWAIFLVTAGATMLGIGSGWGRSQPPGEVAEGSHALRGGQDPAVGIVAWSPGSV